VLDKLVGGYKATVSGVTAAQAIAIAADGHVSTVQISDTGANIQARLDDLQDLGAQISGITQSDADALTITASQLSANARVLTKFGAGKPSLIVTEVAAANVASLVGNSKITALRVEDSAYNIAANLDALQTHQLKIGTIADLIEHRSRTESLVQRLSTRTLVTAHGEFTAHAYKVLPSDSVHLALVRGEWSPGHEVLARVHEPLSVLDALEPQRVMHSWSLDAALQRIAKEQAGVLVLLNCGESGEQLLAQFEGVARSAQAPERGRMDLRTYGIGAQILRDCGVHKMRLMGNPRRMWRAWIPRTLGTTRVTRVIMERRLRRASSL
jgi:GTP cyclohydrolase II